MDILFSVSSLSFGTDFKSVIKENRKVKTFFAEAQSQQEFHTVYLVVYSVVLCMLVFSIWQLKNKSGLIFGWTCLEFKVHPSKWHHPGISCLLITFPYLETLTMYIYPSLWHPINEVKEVDEFLQF